MESVAGILRNLWYGFTTVVFPNLCEVCGQTLVTGERTICTKCLMNLPRISQSAPRGLNSVERKCFISNCCVAGTALYRYYRHDPYSQLIKKSKYQGRRDIARNLGVMLARERKPTGFFDTIDYLIPVPIHFFKRIKRGYNQSEEICIGISSVTGIQVTKNLYAKRGHKSQTYKNATDRWNNTEGLFAVKNPKQLENKHIAIVDDVITTGATMQHSAMVLRDCVPGIRISFIAIGTTEH